MVQDEMIYKDRTRDNNQYFGIGWGYKADEMIQEKIDTGDIFFLKFKCSECINLRNSLKCYFM